MSICSNFTWLFSEDCSNTFNVLHNCCLYYGIYCGFMYVHDSYILCSCKVAHLFEVPVWWTKCKFTVNECLLLPTGGVFEEGGKCPVETDIGPHAGKDKVRCNIWKTDIVSSEVCRQ